MGGKGKRAQLSSRIWPVNLQYPTTGLGISNFEKNFKFKFQKKNEKSLKRLIWKLKVLNSHTWRQDSRPPQILWQLPTIGMGISNLNKKKANLGFLNFFEKIARKCRIAKTTKN